ncbi:zinc finger protein 106 [Xenopus tropicalis]|uniref:Zinc finger protein 106 n=1 Tax=Xenopus tropicalis TaxID=8364 RepID=A0A8J0QGH8_XENTR|nr:zinc finger protein 106 [Xenopus tropicalis]|eukprot:NP_001182712.1 zinc finger protein 106 [Xenopus tropicalis]
MVRERKCILCHIVYSSKKEMDEHMRSMLHHRELENIRGRDCNHECRVCQVTVVGLSTYAKHISSQLHKDNVDAQDKEEEKEEAEEEYFDKELIQLINQRKEQCKQEEVSCLSKGQKPDGKQQRQDNRVSFNDLGAQAWHHCEQSGRGWQWQNECFANNRQGNFLHPALSVNPNMHLGGPRGQAGWNMKGPLNRHMIHSQNGGSWHSNSGRAAKWHHRGTGGNFHWYPEGNGKFPNQHPRNCGGNWPNNHYSSKNWNFGSATEPFSHGRNRPLENCDSTKDKDLGWNNNCTSNMFKLGRFLWKQKDNKNGAPNPAFQPPHNANKVSSEDGSDFTSDTVPDNNLFGFTVSDKSSKSKPLLSSLRNNSVCKDKPLRWTPYPSQKGTETFQPLPKGLDTNLPFQFSEMSNTDADTDKAENFSNPQTEEDQNEPDTYFDGCDSKKADQADLKRVRMLSLKSPRSVPDFKFSFKKDGKNPLKVAKHLFPMTFEERQSRLSALNLETRPTFKLHSSSKDIKKHKQTQDCSQKEPVETLAEVLQKAKEILQNSQAVQSSHYCPAPRDGLINQSITANVLNNPQKTINVSKDTFGNVGHTQNSSDKGKILDNEYPRDCVLDYDAKSEKTEDALEKLAKSLDLCTNSDPDTSSVEPNIDSFRPHFKTELCTEEENQDTDVNHQCQDINDAETFETISDLELQKGASNSSGPRLPELSKLGLPASFQRDLTRHIGSRNKTGSHLPEPNLNNARRIRNVSGHRKNETDKDSGLKPTLRQILNASRRNINWEQIMQHITKKRQELGKGLPRFGIEMVAHVQSEQEGLDFDEDTELSIENFPWEGICARKRSLSESSVAVDKASVYDVFNGHESELCRERSIPSIQGTLEQSGPNASSAFMFQPKIEEEDDIPISYAANSNALSDLLLAETSQSQNVAITDSPCTLQSANEDVHQSAADASAVSPNMDAGTDSCTSGTELNDGQGTGKKRRATGDACCPEIPSLERKTKRRKIRGRKERSQVDQLLSISLREEELNNSLLNVDTDLHQARAALQAAYLEVQRLLVLKQQITLEMSKMRTQRIHILQGLQGSYEPANDTAKESSPRPQTPVVSPGSVFNYVVQTPPYVAPCVESSTLVPSPVQSITPPSFATPDSSVVIKQEPMSPEREIKSTSAVADCPVISPLSSGDVLQNASVYPVITATISLSEQANNLPMVKNEFFQKPRISETPSPSFEFSQVNCKQERESSDHTTENPSPPQALSMPACPQKTNNNSAGPATGLMVESTLSVMETRAGKKKKKLRKKKTLRAAHVPDNSDTEQDIYTGKPVRKVRSRRCSKETVVSTSTSVEQEPDATSQETEQTKDNNDSDSNVELVEIPLRQFEVVPIDSDDEKPDSPSKMDMVISRQANSDANEVTSTSEIGTNFMEESLTSSTKYRRLSCQGSKNSSEVSSEPGEDEEPTEGKFEGHTASVNTVQIHQGLLYTCSADKTVRVYNLTTRQCVAVFEGHTSKVNCLVVTCTYKKSLAVFTGSSDHTIRCYSVKTREFQTAWNLGERVLCFHVRWKILFAGLANGNVVTFSLKSKKQTDVFECHGPRAVSCMATAQEGSRKLLLVGSYDCTISVRDACNGLLLRTLEGHSKTVLCMKVVNDLVFSGSSDQSVHAHNIHTGELVRIYKGHNHAVTVVYILGKVMVTACLDKFVRVYDLQSHDRLQVYGGHSDMIMCMTIHKNMIYTGCYDGSVQAVHLNLLQSFRCWWHGCSLTFGVVDHLKQHLFTDHTNPNFQTLKCRWKNCDFIARRGSKQDTVGHIEQHAEECNQINT